MRRILLLAMFTGSAATGAAMISPKAAATGWPAHWPDWATDTQTLCEGLGLWGWVEPEPLPGAGTNTVRLVIRPADPADWPECGR